MGSSLLTRYAEHIAGVLHSYDRVVIRGMLPFIGFAEGMTTYLHSQHIRIFDYPQFAKPLRDELCQHAQQLATKHGITLEHVRKALLVGERLGDLAHQVEAQGEAEAQGVMLYVRDGQADGQRTETPGRTHLRRRSCR